VFYAAFPPEFNSGRMYSGPGAQSMRAAAAAWEDIASELQSAAASYSSVISTLTGEAWSGPSALSMEAAVTPYVSWMQSTATQAAEAASQATAAANAYDTAFQAHVPPAEIAANRCQLASLVRTNIFGQNTAAIAETETQYAEMWAQDALAMDSYAGSSAAASRLMPFRPAPQVTNPGGLPCQAGAVAQAAGTPATSVQSLLCTLEPLTTANPVLQWLANLSTDYTDTLNNLMNCLFGSNGAAMFQELVTAVDAPTAYTLQYADVGVMTTFPIAQFLKFAPTPALVLPKEELGGGLGLLAPSLGRGAALFGSVSASMGDAGTLVQNLSTPPSWAIATPAVRTVAAALSAAGPQAVPAATLAEGSLLGSMSIAASLGSALGAGAPSAIARTAVRGGFAASNGIRDKHSPEQLQRLAAQISEKPESVQHHTVDQDGLDGLLEQLSKKPGIHAVHLTNGGNAKIVPSDRRSG
jgi:PPE-repeat protein